MTKRPYQYRFWPKAQLGARKVHRGHRDAPSAAPGCIHWQSLLRRLM